MASESLFAVCMGQNHVDPLFVHESCPVSSPTVNAVNEPAMLVAKVSVVMVSILNAYSTLETAGVLCAIVLEPREFPPGGEG